MKCFITVHNMSVNDDAELQYVVVRIENGEAFYYGAWSNKEVAEKIARELGNALVLARV